MEKNSEFHLYKDINARTGGEIYLGVAGPVRTGKSTMIKRFLEELVLPSMEDSPDKERTRDQIPQSASRTYNYDNGAQVYSEGRRGGSVRGELPAKSA